MTTLLGTEHGSERTRRAPNETESNAFLNTSKVRGPGEGRVRRVETRGSREEGGKDISLSFQLIADAT